MAAEQRLSLSTAGFVAFRRGSQRCGVLYVRVSAPPEAGMTVWILRETVSLTGRFSLSCFGYLLVA